MGYYSDVEGRLTFSKTLTGKEWQLALDYVSKNVRNAWVLADATSFDEEDVFVDVDGAKLYSFEREVEALVEYLKAVDVRMNGEVVVVGEETGDIWRLIVENNKVRKETARITWPDGTDALR